MESEALQKVLEEQSQMTKRQKLSETEHKERPVKRQGDQSASSSGSSSYSSDSDDIEDDRSSRSSR